jgi:hypothetical protein
MRKRALPWPLPKPLPVAPTEDIEKILKHVLERLDAIEKRLNNIEKLLANHVRYYKSLTSVWRVWVKIMLPLNGLEKKKKKGYSLFKRSGSIDCWSLGSDSSSFA